MFALLAVASAGIIPQQAYTTYQHAAPVVQHYAQPAVVHAAPVVQHYAHQPTVVKTIAHQPALVKHVEYEAPAEYNFAYSVHDAHTGDIKSQQESRHGDNVQGEYSLIDADGFKRTVQYTADEHHGFNAVVHREPLAHKVVAAAPVVKHVVQAPTVVKTVAAPVAHYAHAPVAHYAQAPVAHYTQAPVAHYAHQQPAYYHH